MLGFPVASNKTVETMMALTFLDIQMNTTEGCLHMPQNKLRQVKANSQHAKREASMFEAYLSSSH